MYCDKRNSVETSEAAQNCSWSRSRKEGCSDSPPYVKIAEVHIDFITVPTPLLLRFFRVGDLKKKGGGTREKNRSVVRKLNDADQGTPRNL